MDQKATIIKRLNMMGYTVGEDSGIYSIALRTSSGHMFTIFTTEEDIMFKEDIVEEIVRDVNFVIKAYI